MPLIDIHTFENGLIRGFWRIEESIDLLAPALPAWEVMQLYKQKTHPQKLLESLAARMLVKEMAEHLGFVYEGLSKTPENAPYFANTPYQISISHTALYAVAVLHPTHVAGTDLEQARAQLQRVAKRMMTTDELAFVQDDLMHLAFLWSAKETLYKIHAQKQLHFTRDMQVMPFKLAESGVFETYLFPKTPQERCILMHYAQIDETHACTWAITNTFIS